MKNNTSITTAPSPASTTGDYQHQNHNHNPPNQQMYKALEAGYQMGLESLNENLGEVRTEMVFVQRLLQFKPPLEELRASYYRDTKKFVSIPNAFEGFGNGKVWVGGWCYL